MKYLSGVVLGLALLASTGMAEPFSLRAYPSGNVIGGGTLTSGRNVYATGSNSIASDANIQDLTDSISSTWGVSGTVSATAFNAISTTTGISGSQIVGPLLVVSNSATGSKVILQRSGTGSVNAQVNASGGIDFGIGAANVLRINSTGFVFAASGIQNPSATAQVSGTFILSPQTVTPSTATLGTMAMNTSGTICIVSPSGVYVKLAAPGTACGFAAGAN